MKKQHKISDIKKTSWVLDILDKIHPDYKEAHVENVETKTMIDDEVVTRYRLLIHEKDGTTSFIGDESGPFEYPTQQLAFRDLQTFHKWQRGDL